MKRRRNFNTIYVDSHHSKTFLQELQRFHFCTLKTIVGSAAPMYMYVPIQPLIFDFLSGHYLPSQFALTYDHFRRSLSTWANRGEVKAHTYNEPKTQLICFADEPKTRFRWPFTTRILGAVERKERKCGVWWGWDKGDGDRFMNTTSTLHAPAVDTTEFRREWNFHLHPRIRSRITRGWTFIRG